MSSVSYGTHSPCYTSKNGCSVQSGDDPVRQNGDNKDKMAQIGIIRFGGGSNRLCRQKKKYDFSFS